MLGEASPLSTMIFFIPLSVLIRLFTSDLSFNKISRNSLTDIDRPISI